MITHIYRDMIFLSDKKRLSAKTKGAIDRQVRQFQKGLSHKVVNGKAKSFYDNSKTMSLFEAKMRTQLSWNHEHFPSKKTALKAIQDINNEVMDKDPGIINRLVFDWRQPLAKTSPPTKEKGNAVCMSCFLDRK